MLSVIRCRLAGYRTARNAARAPAMRAAAGLPPAAAAAAAGRERAVHVQLGAASQRGRRLHVDAARKTKVPLQIFYNDTYEVALPPGHRFPMQKPVAPPARGRCRGRDSLQLASAVTGFCHGVTYAAVVRPWPKKEKR